MLNVKSSTIDVNGLKMTMELNPHPPKLIELTGTVLGHCFVDMDSKTIPTGTQSQNTQNINVFIMSGKNAL